jgi:3-phenylpropionate/trans-cinnamate dioxygenase ferredoxin subunit
MGDYVKACNLADVPPGTMLSVDIGEVQMMIVNTDGALYAVSRICTHETADLSTGFLIGSEVTCPLHLSRFDLKTGAVQNPPATIPLTSYKLKTEGEAVYVQIQP